MAIAQPDTAVIETQAHGCPYPHNARKSTGMVEAPPAQVVRRDDGTWIVHGFEAARQVLRSESVHQSGFRSEEVTTMGVMKRMPVLYLDGAEHTAVRGETARFFTPAHTSKHYYEIMDDLADQAVATVQREQQVNVSALAMDLAVRVAAQVVGLTNSRMGGMDRRFDRILAANSGGAEKSWLARMGDRVNNVLLLAFLYLDVKPAAAARRREPGDDVISYLVGQGYSDVEILTESLIYGVAGMVTTREFINMALWHLLENEPLRQRYLIAEQDERYAILHEILRLEPIIEHLFRRTTADLTLETDEGPVTIPAGARIDISIYNANGDTDVYGADAGELCPVRQVKPLRPKAGEMGLSFGDGPHRCPGAYLAIQESDVFLRKLLALDLRIVQPPTVTYSELVMGYELRDFVVAVG
jgi:cytochrome P450